MDDTVTYCVRFLDNDPCWYKYGFPIHCDNDCPFYRHCTKEEYKKLLHEIEMRRNAKENRYKAL